MNSMKYETQTYYGQGMSELRPVPEPIRKSVKVLRAINHKLRQRIIDMIRSSGSLSVTDIYIRLRLEQSIASQHLAILRRAGVVITTRQGKFIMYEIDEDRIQTILSCCKQLA